MVKSRKSAEIIDRIEYIRNYLRLNKSRFSSEIGLKPQTYNNFIGSQGSKPSVDLVLGVVNRFGASPNWILNGNGPVFQEWTPDQEQRSRPAADTIGWSDQFAEPGTMSLETDLQRADMQQKLATLEEKMREAERRLEAIEGSRFPMLREIREMFMRLVDRDPARAEEFGTDLIGQLKRQLSD